MLILFHFFFMFEHQVQEQTGRHEAPETDYVLFFFKGRKDGIILLLLFFAFSIC